MKFRVTTEVDVTPAELKFVQTMARNPHFWGQSVGYAMRGTPAIRASLKAKGLVRTERRPVINGAGETFLAGELTETGRALVVAAAEASAAIQA